MVGNAKDFIMKFGNDWVMNLAAMLAYNILTAIIPILLALLTVLGIVLQGNHDLLVNIENGMLGALPGNLHNVIDIRAALVNLQKNTGLLGIVSFMGLLLTGTNLFGCIENAFSIIYRTKSRDIIPQKVMALTMLVIFVVLAPLMVGASTLINLISTGAHALVPVDNTVTQLFWQGASLLAAALIAFVLFVTIYTVVPNLPLNVRHSWRGALVAGVLLVIIDLIFPAYTTLFIGKPNNYGATAFLALVIMAWLWLFSTILLLGAEINSYAMGMRATKGDLATEFHHERVHEAGEDVPPSHAGKTEAGKGGEHRADKLEEPSSPTAAPDTRQDPTTEPAEVPGKRRVPLPVRVASVVVGGMGKGVLMVFWLILRAVRRQPDAE